ERDQPVRRHRHDLRALRHLRHRGAPGGRRRHRRRGRPRLGRRQCHQRPAPLRDRRPGGRRRGRLLARM
ncbi:MAG: Copper(I) chaperone CopZ, partial [uncultured Nocardioides sp.]